jgi:hypothetical protein
MFRKVWFGALALLAIGTVATSVLGAPPAARQAPAAKERPPAVKLNPGGAGNSRAVPISQIRLIGQKDSSPRVIGGVANDNVNTTVNTTTRNITVVDTVVATNVTAVSPSPRSQMLSRFTVPRK